MFAYRFFDDTALCQVFVLSAIQFTVAPEPFFQVECPELVVEIAREFLVAIAQRTLTGEAPSALIVALGP